MKVFTSILAFVLVASAAQTCRPENGYVPDSSTAVKIAEAVLIPVYGEKVVESERPFRATLKNDIWTIGGTLYCADGKLQCTQSPTCVGGVAVVKISKTDGRIIFMTHYK